MARARGRPAPAPARRAPAPQQTRPASTASVPATTAQAPALQQTRPASTASVPATTAQAPPPAASQSPGLFGQMASTAAGVAVGSTVGHMLGSGISGLFGGSSSPEAPTAAAEPVQAQSTSSSSWDALGCEADAKSFTKCLDDNQGNMQICSWYLEQLKACQNMAKSYNQ